MNESNEENHDSNEEKHVGRWPALDQDKRNKIIALLSLGCSRRIAALYVGCSPSTITRTAIRDADFFDQLINAELHSEVDALRHLRRASRKERYWRAAAWLLERRNPDDFGKREPNTVSEEKTHLIIDSIYSSVLKDLPPDIQETIMQRLDVVFADKLKTMFPEPPKEDENTQEEDFATNSMKAVDYLDDDESSQLDDPLELPEIDIDATLSKK
jgi:hypothetical protein